MKPGPEDRPLVGVAVIVERGGRVLLGKRKNTHGAGTWALPGGHLEYGETVEACATREVLEETGLEIRGLSRGPYSGDVFEKEKKHYVTLFVRAEAPEGEPGLLEPDKCEAWGWFSWDALPGPRFAPLESLLALTMTGNGRGGGEEGPGGPGGQRPPKGG